MMSLLPDSELIQALSRAIERLLRSGGPRNHRTARATRRFWLRIQSDIRRWEQATLEQDRPHQEFILDQINADQHLDFEVGFHDYQEPSYVNRTAEGNNHELDMHALRTFLELVYSSIYCLFRPSCVIISSYFSSWPAPFDETLAAQAVFQILGNFLYEVKTTLKEWERACQWQQNTVNDLRETQHLITDNSSPETSQLETDDPIQLSGTSMGNHDIEIDIPDSLMAQREEDLPENVSRHVSRYIELTPDQGTEYPRIESVDQEQASSLTPGSRLQLDMTHRVCSVLALYTRLQHALSLLELERPERTHALGRLVSCGFLATELEGASECPICLQDLLGSDILVELLCEHKYHTHCISEWLGENNTCPLCRREVFIFG